MLSAQCPPPCGPGVSAPTLYYPTSLPASTARLRHYTQYTCTSMKDPVISPSFGMAVIRAWYVRDCRCLLSHSVETVTPVSFIHSACNLELCVTLCWCECWAYDCPVSRRRWLLKTSPTRCWQRSQRKDITVVPRWRSLALDRSAWPPPSPWWHRSDFFLRIPLTARVLASQADAPANMATT